MERESYHILIAHNWVVETRLNETDKKNFGRSGGRLWIMR